jgi:hypothetical protein
MMIILNLISNLQRRRVRQRWATTELRSIAVTILFVVVLASVMLYGARDLLSNTRDLFTTDLLATTAATTVADDDTDTAQILESALTAGTDWHTFLVAVSAAVPSGVQLATLSVDDSGNVRLTGQADTRAALLQLQEQLRASGAIADLYSPVRNLLQPNDVVFELTGRLATTTAP